MQTNDTDESAKRVLHGNWNATGSKRYCRECEEWVAAVEWMEHRDHGNWRLEVDLDGR